MRFILQLCAGLNMLESIHGLFLCAYDCACISWKHCVPGQEGNAEGQPVFQRSKCLQPVPAPPLLPLLAASVAIACINAAYHPLSFCCGRSKAVDAHAAVPQGSCCSMSSHCTLPTLLPMMGQGLWGHSGHCWVLIGSSPARECKHGPQLRGERDAQCSQ